MPRQIYHTVYKIDEHPSPEKVFEWWRATTPPDAWAYEWVESLNKAWKALFHNYVPYWEHNWDTVSINFKTGGHNRFCDTLSAVDDIALPEGDEERGQAEMTGLRLWKYVQNSLDWDMLLYRRNKMAWGRNLYGVWVRKAGWQFDKDEKRVPAPGHLSIVDPEVEHDCPFTGFFSDEVFLKPIREFMRRPTEGTRLRDLAEAAVEAWAKGWSEDMQSQQTEEYLRELFQGNECEFHEDGRLLGYKE